MNSVERERERGKDALITPGCFSHGVLKFKKSFLKNEAKEISPQNRSSALEKEYHQD